MISFDEENEYLPIKTVAEYFYCQRAAFYMLTHWENNIESKFFFKGTQQHRVIDKIPYKHRRGSKIIYHYSVISQRFRLYGICDAVEFKNKNNFYPIEYKTGKIRFNFMHRAQLAFQIICLEEMFKCRIPYGYIYFIESHKRRKVSINLKERKYILEKLSEFRKKLKRPEIKKFKPCKSIFCSYHLVDEPILYK